MGYCSDSTMFSTVEIGYKDAIWTKGADLLSKRPTFTPKRHIRAMIYWVRQTGFYKVAIFSANFSENSSGKFKTIQAF